MAKPKVLVIRKPDRTIHQIPIANKATIMGFNNRLSAADQWSIEEMSEEEAAKLPYIDEGYVTASDAQDKIKEKDKEIEDLKKRLALVNQNLPTETAQEKIARINQAESAESVNAILGDDDRVTVKNAADKMIASFS